MFDFFMSNFQLMILIHYNSESLYYYFSFILAIKYMKCVKDELGVKIKRIFKNLNMHKIC